MNSRVGISLNLTLERATVEVRNDGAGFDLSGHFSDHFGLVTTRGGPRTWEA